MNSYRFGASDSRGAMLAGNVEAKDCSPLTSRDGLGGGMKESAGKGLSCADRLRLAPAVGV